MSTVFNTNNQPKNQLFQVRLSPLVHNNVIKDFDSLENAVQYANQWAKDFNDPDYQSKLSNIDSIIIVNLLTNDIVDIIEIFYKNVGKANKNKILKIQKLKALAEKCKKMGLTFSELNENQNSVFYVKAKGEKIGTLIWAFSDWMIERTSEEFDIYFPTYWDEMKQAIANICGIDRD